MTFDGFPRATFAWFDGLLADNSRTYMDATRALFERDVRGALLALLEELSGGFGGTADVLRQHRDTRFSSDKSSYKTRTYGRLDGTPAATLGLYAELSAAGLYAGAGYPWLLRDQLARYRAAVREDGAPLQSALDAARAAGLEIAGGELKTAPRGVPRDDPHISLLRRTGLIAGLRLPPGADGLTRAAALEHVAGTWRATAPLTAWLDARVGPTTEPPRSRR